MVQDFFRFTQRRIPMPKGIKTKRTVKDIKLLDKAAAATAHMKRAFVRSKQSAEATQQPEGHSPTDYAADKVAGGAQEAVQKTVSRIRHPSQKTKQAFDRAKAQFRKAQQELPKTRKQAAEQARQSADISKATADKLGKTAAQTQQTVLDARQAARSSKQAERSIKTTAKSAKSTGRVTGKGTIKTVQKSVKTAERSAKTTVKTAQQAAKATQKSAQVATKSTKLAAQTSRTASKTAVQSAKAAVRGTVAAVKATVAAAQGLVSLIAAGGWVAVAIIVLMCLIGLLLGSVFGVFFSGEDTGTSRAMPNVVSELTTEFYGKVEDIKTKNTHDVVDMEAMSIHWPEVLAVYAVKVNSDPDNPAEVVTLDADKVEQLRSVLHDMVSLSHSLKTETQERTVTTTNADGSITESTETVTIIRLIISLEQKSADDMATQYGFSQTQKDQMHELLSPDYADLWAQLLGGYSAGSGTIGTPDGSHIPKDIFSWPIGEGFSISSGFGYRKDPFSGETKYHGGTDIAAPEGTPILAAADGVVVLANGIDTWGNGYGYHVKIQHNSTYSTLYAHCSKIAVVVGQEVRQGEVIGFVGTTGNSTGYHLHFEVWTGGARMNPLGYFV
jgi:murein DD-endopeptidase MepM/ murein hydrolase activator NlpD